MRKLGRGLMWALSAYVIGLVALAVAGTQQSPAAGLVLFICSVIGFVYGWRTRKMRS